MTMRFSVGPKSYTPRSHYRIDEDGIEYMKRNIVAFKGKCIVTASADDYFGGEESRGYRSRVLEDRKSTRLNSSHSQQSRMPSSA